MTDLAAWLLEQVDADEAEARGVLTQRWDAISFHDEARDDIPHIVRWSPARVLAECAAKRRLVQQLQEVSYGDGPESDSIHGQRQALEWAVAFLAQPYRDREGWRDEWEVET